MVTSDFFRKLVNESYDSVVLLDLPCSNQILDKNHVLNLLRDDYPLTFTSIKGTDSKRRYGSYCKLTQGRCTFCFVFTRDRRVKGGMASTSQVSVFEKIFDSLELSEEIPVFNFVGSTSYKMGSATESAAFRLRCASSKKLEKFKTVVHL